jgi:hypothetical protein
MQFETTLFVRRINRDLLFESLDEDGGRDWRLSQVTTDDLGVMAFILRAVTTGA